MRIYQNIVDDFKSSAKRAKESIFQKKCGYITSSELKDRVIKRRSINNMEWY